MIERCDKLTIKGFYRKMVDEHIPLNVLLEVTHRCNLKCAHCYVVADKDPRLSLTEIQDILVQLAKAKSLVLTLTGGEIFLRRDLFEITDFAKGLNFAIRLFTNGTLITEELADRIAAVQPLDVSISIYGADAAGHELVTRAAGSYEKSIGALRMLKARGVATRLKCILMKHNFRDMMRTAAFADSIGAFAQFDPLVTPKTDGNNAPLAYRLGDDELVDLLAMEEPHPTASPDERIFCTAGRDMVSISPSGKVYPCVQMPTLLGDLRKQNFSDIWSSQVATELRALRVGDLGTCAACSYVDQCRPCPGLNVIENGNWLKPAQQNCRVAHLRNKAKTLARQGAWLKEVVK